MNHGHDVMEAIGLLRAGATPTEAWRESFGVDVDADGAPKIDDAAHLDGAVALRAAGRLAHRSGAPLAQVLETIEEAERGRRRAEDARDAALAGPRASTRVLMILPAIGWLFAVALDPGAAHVLVATGLGWALLGVTGSLWWTGGWWLRRMVSHAERAGADAGPASLPLALAEAAVGAGLDVRSCLGEVGHALASPTGADLEVVAHRLADGETWARAWRDADPTTAPLERAMRSAWLRGASPGPTLRAARESVIETGRRAAEQAAARVGVMATLPLALCLLPGFIAVSVVPLIVSLVAGFGEVRT